MVDRHRFDVDPDPTFHFFSCRSRSGTVSGCYPRFYTCWKIRIFFTFIQCCGVLLDVNQQRWLHYCTEEHSLSLIIKESLRVPDRDSNSGPTLRQAGYATHKKYTYLFSRAVLTSACFTTCWALTSVTGQIWAMSRYTQNNTEDKYLFTRPDLSCDQVHTEKYSRRLLLSGSFSTIKCYFLKKTNFFLPDLTWAMSRYPQNNTLTTPFSRVLFLPANVCSGEDKCFFYRCLCTYTMNHSLPIFFLLYMWVPVQVEFLLFDNFDWL